MQLKKLIIAVAVAVIVIVLLIVGGAVYALLLSGLIKSSVIDSVTDQEVLEQLKKIILLPDDVTPTMAIVMDAEKLKESSPDFFSNVKNGDRLILYPDLAIVYDYNANKIIKVGPVQTPKK